jgi:uncharacterized protein DUF3386
MTPVSQLAPGLTVPDAVAARPPVWPSSVAADDARAALLLQRAQGTFQKWPEGFRGFHAEIRCGSLEREAAGTVAVIPGRDIDARVDDPELATVVDTMLRHLTVARAPRFFKDGDGRFPITMPPADGHPLGSRIVVHEDDGRWHAYRVNAAGWLRVEERELDSTLAVTTFEECARAMPGRVLPTRTVTAFFDRATGALVRTETIVERHVRVDHVWLPESHRITVTGSGGGSTLLEFSAHVLL